jgi:hypothetical protein
VFDGTGILGEVRSFYAYAADFQGGVTVAAGNVGGDGRADIITGAGPGGAPHVKVFDGAGVGGELRSFYAYAADFHGGVFVAVGRVTGDAVLDIITGAGPGGAPHVKVFDGFTGAEVRSFFAYALGVDGGVRVAAVDLTGDAIAELITGAGPGGRPHVRVFDPNTLAEIRGFYAFNPDYLGGVSVGGGVVTTLGR